MSTQNEGVPDQQPPVRTEPGGTSARTLARWAARLIAGHKVVSGSVAVFVAAAIAVSLATTSASSHSYPAAPKFQVAVLGKPGTKISLSQFKGKPLVLNFWASWCDVCQTETPLLASWYKQQHGHVIMIGLDENDGAAKALAYAHAKGMTYPIGFDPLVTVASAYGVAGLPQTFFLNAQHRIVDHLLGRVTRAEMNKGLKLMNGA